MMHWATLLSAWAATARDHREREREIVRHRQPSQINGPITGHNGDGGKGEGKMKKMAKGKGR
jgi:hypothetical protein